MRRGRADSLGGSAGDVAGKKFLFAKKSTTKKLHGHTQEREMFLQGKRDKKSNHYHAWGN